MRRSAFTLIEMLVVIGIIVVLASLSVAIIPAVHNRTKAQRGADNTQGWLLIGRERALRDHAPRGIRLLVDADGYVRSMVFIEQPDVFTGGVLQFDPNDPTHAVVAGPDLTGGFGASTANQPYWPVQVGDYLQFQDGTSYVISSVNMTPPPLSVPSPNAIYTTNPMWLGPAGTNPPPGNTSNYVIRRAPRQTAGEDVLRLPDDVVIDLTLSRPSPMVLTSLTGVTYADILFTPSGALTGLLGDSNGKIILWLRDVTKDYPLPPNPQASTGDQPLLVIYTRTGRVAAVQFNNDPNVPAPGAYDPYFYAYDPRSSGL
jgi:prepilin-type N-terminal cleavage/methylation domain-containing protein